MRFVSLILLSFIATNTVAIHTPKVYPVYVRDFHLSKGGRSNRPSSCQPNPTGANEQSGPSQRTPFTSRVLGRVTGSLTNIRDLCGRRREHNDAVSVENNQVRSSVPKEAVEYQPPDSPEGEMEVSIPDPFLLEEGIIERITLLKEAVKKAMTKKQEAKDQVKKSQATSDKATTDRSSNSDLDESENDPELPIEIAQEASPSLTEQTYEAHMEELWSINSLVEQIVKNIIWIRRDKQGYRVTQKAAIKRSRGYLQELTNIGNLMMKTWGTLPEKSKFKDGDGLLELLLRVDEFKAITDDALLRSRWEHIKGREGLVTSKEKLDKKKKKLHKTTILEETEDEEEEQDAKYRAVYEQSDKK